MKTTQGGGAAPDYTMSTTLIRNLLMKNGIMCCKPKIYITDFFLSFIVWSLVRVDYFYYNFVINACGNGKHPYLKVCSLVSASWVCLAAWYWIHSFDTGSLVKFVNLEEKMFPPYFAKTFIWHLINLFYHLIDSKKISMFTLLH